MIGFAARQLRRLVALVALAAMLIGAPYALYKLGLPLLPDHVPGLAEIWQRLTERDTGQVFLGFLVIVGAVAWAIFAITVLVEIASHLAHRPDWHLPGLHLPQAAAGALIGMLIAGTIATSATPAIAASLPLLPHPAAAVASVSVPFPAAQSAVRHGSLGVTTHLAAPTRTARTAAATGPTWTVSKGDSLWSIAEKTLGSGRRFGEIAALNQGRTQPDGRTLEQANFLLPGWILHLPADAHLPAGAGSAPALGGGTAETVTVEPGDTLSQIALDELGDSTRYPELAAANHIANPDLIHPGQTIRIPAPSTAPATAAGVSAPVTASDGPQGHAGPDPQEAGSDSADSVHQGNEPTPPKHGQADADTDDGADAGRLESGSPDPEAYSAGGTGSGDAAAEAAPIPTAADGAGIHPESIAPSEVAASGGAKATGAASNSEPAGATPSAGTRSGPSSRRTLVLGGVTALTAALVWAGLLATRRRLEQSRRPGQRIPLPPTELAARVEQALRRRTDPITPDRINRALRTITPLLTDQPGIRIAGALIGPDSIELRLSNPAPPRAPFTGADTAWTLHLPDTDPDEAFDYENLAALPSLATVGTTSDGRVAMVNLEQIGALHIGGDRERAGELINHLVIELSQSPWTDGIHLHVAGLPGQIRSLDTDRIQPVDDLPAAVRFVAAHTKTIRALLRGRDVTLARTDNTYADTWEPHLLIADGREIAAAGSSAVIGALEAGPAAAAALVTTGTNPGIAAAVDIGADGTAVIPAIFGNEMITIAGATDAEIAALADLFAARPVETDRVVDEADPNDSATDEAGPDDTEIDVAPGVEGCSDTKIVIPDVETYEAATILADALPSARNGALTLEIRNREPQTNDPVGDIDPHDPDTAIDDDLAEWRSNTVARPKIAILGPARVTGRGPTPERTQPRQIEMAVYLALYSQGVTADKFAADLWPEGAPPTPGGRRVAISRLRNWLGEDPVTAEPFIPHGEGGYYLTDRIVDSELFGRLVRRSERRAKVGDARDALDDLQHALELVRGPILPEAGGPQYMWMAAAERMEDRTLPMAVIDAAHAATDLALAIGDVAIAESAAMTGRRIEPYSTIPLCDLIRISQYCGDDASAANWAQTVMTVSEVDVIADLPEHLQQTVADALPRQGRRPSHDDRQP